MVVAILAIVVSGVGYKLYQKYKKKPTDEPKTGEGEEESITPPTDTEPQKEKDKPPQSSPPNTTPTGTAPTGKTPPGKTPPGETPKGETPKGETPKDVKGGSGGPQSQKKPGDATGTETVKSGAAGKGKPNNTTPGQETPKDDPTKTGANVPKGSPKLASPTDTPKRSPVSAEDAAAQQKKYAELQAKAAALDAEKAAAEKQLSETEKAHGEQAHSKKVQLTGLQTEHKRKRQLWENKKAQDDAARASVATLKEELTKQEASIAATPGDTALVATVADTKKKIEAAEKDLDKQKQERNALATQLNADAEVVKKRETEAQEELAKKEQEKAKIAQRLTELTASRAAIDEEMKKAQPTHIKPTIPQIAPDTQSKPGVQPNNQGGGPDGKKVPIVVPPTGTPINQGGNAPGSLQSTEPVMTPNGNGSLGSENEGESMSFSIIRHDELPREDEHSIIIISDGWLAPIGKGTEHLKGQPSLQFRDLNAQTSTGHIGVGRRSKRGPKEVIQRDPEGDIKWSTRANIVDHPGALLLIPKKDSQALIEPTIDDAERKRYARLRFKDLPTSGFPLYKRVEGSEKECVPMSTDMLLEANRVAARSAEGKHTVHELMSELDKDRAKFVASDAKAKYQSGIAQVFKDHRDKMNEARAAQEEDIQALTPLAAKGKMTKEEEEQVRGILAKQVKQMCDVKNAFLKDLVKAKEPPVVFKDSPSAVKVLEECKRIDESAKQGKELVRESFETYKKSLAPELKKKFGGFDWMDPSIMEPAEIAAAAIKYHADNYTADKDKTVEVAPIWAVAQLSVEWRQHTHMEKLQPVMVDEVNRITSLKALEVGRGVKKGVAYGAQMMPELNKDGIPLLEDQALADNVKNIKLAEVYQNVPILTKLAEESMDQAIDFVRTHSAEEFYTGVKIDDDGSVISTPGLLSELGGGLAGRPVDETQL